MSAVVADARIHLFDIARGACVLSMVMFHYSYDLTELAGVNLVWFRPPLEDIWRASISWSFLFIAGLMCSFSRSNFKRGLRYSAVALAVWAATTVVAVDIPISFGIIFCMAASTLVYSLLQRIYAQPRGVLAAAVLFTGFLLLLNVPSGSVAIGSISWKLPSELYASEWLSWLGFPGPSFFSGDYYPLLPYSLMYLAGSSLGPGIRQIVKISSIANVRCKPLELIGRHALAIYVVHQPILLVLSGVAIS